MVLNNVTKFHKILIKSIQLRERTSLGQKDGRTGVTLNAPSIVMGGGGGIKKSQNILNWIKNVWASSQEFGTYKKCFFYPNQYIYAVATICLFVSFKFDALCPSQQFIQSSPHVSWGKPVLSKG